MLKKDYRLRHKKDFDRLATQGRSVFGLAATMRIRPVKEAIPKVAFITSTKVFKLAVDRNRIKRRFRAILRDVFLEIPSGVHVLFVIKPDAAKLDHLSLVADIRHLLGKIPEALTKPPKPSPGAVRLAAKRKARGEQKKHGTTK